MDKVKKRIIFFVCTTHCLFFLYTAFSRPVHKEQSKPLIVKTVHYAPAPKETVVAARTEAAPVPAKKPAQEKKAPPIAEKKIVKETKKPKTEKKKEPEQRERMAQKLLQDLEESLSRLEEIPTKKPRGMPASAPSFQESDGSYQATLVGYLKQVLNLPEFGEVKIQLTLKQDGSLVNLLVLKAESEKNRKYLEESLPRLRFPAPSGKKKQETFIVTFCNEL